MKKLEEVNQDWCEAVSQDLQQLAVLHDREADETLINALREVDFPHNLGFPIITNDATQVDVVKDAKAKAGQAVDNQQMQPQRFVETALKELPNEIDQQTLDNLAVDYADIYLNHSLHASPYESVWLDEDNLIQQEPMFKVREWYKRYGLGSTDWRVRSDDHIVLQLQFIAHLLDPEFSTSKEVPLQKRLEDAANFMDEHLLLWLPNFCRLIMQRCATDFYASVVVLTNAYIEQLRDTLADITNIARPTQEEIEERRLQASRAVVEEPISFVPGVAESW